MEINTSCPTKTPLSEAVNSLADQCVKCALCLEHCPTYSLSEDENESPRGRIALFQALAKETLPLTAKVKQHLSQCLGCRACEKVCPANVEYGALLAKGRAMVNTLNPTLTPPTFSVRFLHWLVQHPFFLSFIHYFLWGLQSLGIRKLANMLGITALLGLSQLDSLLPTLRKPRKIQSEYQPFTQEKGTVTLFKGCLHALCDEETLFASLFVLRTLSFKVFIPQDQSCCGAMALHAGAWQDAQKLAQKNIAAFTNLPPLPMITLASGCQSVLQDYEKHFNSTAWSSSQMSDVMRFLEQNIDASSLTFSPIAAKIMVHTPCTARNAVKNPPDVLRLLSNIPHLQAKGFSSPYCCGSAGTYSLSHPDFAEPLREKLLSELDGKIDYLVTSNIGCALYFKEALQKSHPAIKVVHPIVLIANSLGFILEPV